MKTNVLVSRRDALLGGVVVGLVVVGCKERAAPTCTDTTGLSPDDLKPRETLAYQDRSPDPHKACDHCAQYVEASSASVCGGCKVLKGPVSPAGTCKVFAPKA